MLVGERGGGGWKDLAEKAKTQKQTKKSSNQKVRQKHTSRAVHLLSCSASSSYPSSLHLFVFFGTFSFRGCGTSTCLSICPILLLLLSYFLFFSFLLVLSYLIGFSAHTHKLHITHVSSSSSSSTTPKYSLLLLLKRYHGSSSR